MCYPSIPIRCTGPVRRACAEVFAASQAYDERLYESGADAPLSVSAAGLRNTPDHISVGKILDPCIQQLLLLAQSREALIRDNADEDTLKAHRTLLLACLDAVSAILLEFIHSPAVSHCVDLEQGLKAIAREVEMQKEALASREDAMVDVSSISKRLADTLRIPPPGDTGRVTVKVQPALQPRKPIMVAPLTPRPRIAVPVETEIEAASSLRPVRIATA